MSIKFSDMPGAEERHLWRKYHHPLLFGDSEVVNQAMVLTAQRHDVETLHDFLGEFRNLVQACIELKPNVDSEVVLALKERLDRAYIVSAGLYGDQTEVQAALQRLIGLIMQAVRRGAEGDALAQSELEQEELARQTNFNLLEHRLVADLMNPHSPIPAHELAATLLSESEPAVAAALWLFDEGQLQSVCGDAAQLLVRLEGQRVDTAQARARLEQLHCASATQTGCGEPLRA